MGESYSLQKLNQRNREVILLYMLGRKQKDIAKQLGYSEPTVSSIINSEPAQDYYQGT